MLTLKARVSFLSFTGFFAGFFICFLSEKGQQEISSLGAIRGSRLQ